MSTLRRFFSVHRALSVGVGCLAALGVGFGVAYAAASSSGSSNNVATAPTTSTTVPAAGQASATTNPRETLRGTITAISGSTWTIQTNNGTTVTVTVTPNTKFLSKGATSSESSFAVGDRVRVAGRSTGPTTIRASRIALTRVA